MFNKKAYALSVFLLLLLALLLLVGLDFSINFLSRQQPFVCFQECSRSSISLIFLLIFLFLRREPVIQPDPFSSPGFC